MNCYSKFLYISSLIVVLQYSENVKVVMLMEVSRKCVIDLRNIYTLSMGAKQVKKPFASPKPSRFELKSPPGGEQLLPVIVPFSKLWT